MRIVASHSGGVWGCVGVRGCGIFRERKNRTFAIVVPSIYTIYIHRIVASRACASPFRTRLRVNIHTRTQHACTHTHACSISAVAEAPAVLQTEAESRLLSSPRHCSSYSSSTSSSILHPSPFQTDWGKAAGFAYIRRHTYRHCARDASSFLAQLYFINIVTERKATRSAVSARNRARLATYAPTYVSSS